MANKEKRQKKYSGPETVSGILEITRSGLGYVVKASDGGGDLLIRPGDFNRAFHGDTVQVRITRGSYGSRNREGRVDEVISRRQTDFIGTLRQHAGRWFFLPDTDKPMPHFELEQSPAEHIDEEGKVLVRFVRWNKEDRRPVGELLEVVSQENLGDIAMKDILLENGFPLSFSDEALEEAERIPDHIPQDEVYKRRDFREVLTFTIDPVDARDFDDALSIRLLEPSLYEIGVHIADVAHYVEEGGVLDTEAYERATSVYLPDRVNPMLPERISNELCSLRPREDKLTFSAVFHISSKGEVKRHWLGKTLIHSNHRFAYEEVQEMIEGGNGPYKEEVMLLNELAKKFRKKRFSQGAINFSSQEVRFKLDESGKPIAVVVKESKEAHQLIEEFMLLANRTVAEDVAKVMVKDKPLPFPYRVHDMPDEDKLDVFVAFARKFGHGFNTSSGEAIASSFNQMLAEAKGTPQQHVLEQLGIRTMAKAVYTTDNIGHYGLGFEHYCHFTSPIRRYPDVLVHRILYEVLKDKKVPHKKLEEKCKHCSERERAAMESERAANKYKQVEYLSDYVGWEFDAVISGVATFGFWAETVEHKCEGLVSMKDLNYWDDFRLVQSDYSLVGLRTARKFRMGDTVRIKVVAANLEKRQLDYEWIPVQQTQDQMQEKATKARKKNGPSPENNVAKKPRKK
jgi:ribonuclease R